jgi:hypothetical protein
MRIVRKRFKPAAAALLLLLVLPPVRAQSPAPADAQAPAGPAAALMDALTAACRADQSQFANSFTADNAAAYRALPAAQRQMLLERFSLSSEAGKPLLSSDPGGHPVLRCEAPGGVNEFRLGEPRVRENLAFVPVTVVDSQQADFGMVRENGQWKVLSLGLLLLDIPKLAAQWADQDMAARETQAVAALQTLANAIDGYRRAFGKLPDSLAQLGPSANGQITPDQASLVTAALASGDDGGFHFRYRVVSAPESTDPRYELGAMPEEYGKTGRQSFFRDASGELHAADRRGAPADAQDPAYDAQKGP